MVYFMENPIKIDDLGGFPIIFGKHPSGLPVDDGWWYVGTCEMLLKF